MISCQASPVAHLSQYKEKHPRVRGKAVFPWLFIYRWIEMRSTWRASERLEERFESCCSDWFAFRRPWLFSQKPENTNKINQFLTFPQVCQWRQQGVLTTVWIRRSNHLHPNYGIDEEEHGYQESYIGKSLVEEKKRGACWKIYVVEHWRTSSIPLSDIK